MGVPLGFWLAFRAGWGLIGLWVGLGAAVTLGCVTTGVQAARDIHRAVADALSHDRAVDHPYDYRQFDDPPREAPKGAPGGSPIASATRTALILLGFLLPGLVAFFGVILCIAPWRPTHPPPPAATMAADRARLSEPLRGLLQGASPCTWSTGGDYYDYPFIAYWNVAQGSYGWEVTIRDRTRAVEGVDGGRRLSAASGAALRLGHGIDVFDQPYAQPIERELEVGWAVWLSPPELVSDDAAGGEWTARAHVGTRVSSAGHTFCGCQFMRGDRHGFRLTEHGRQLVDIDQKSRDESPWYLNLTRRQINRRIEETCRPFSSRPCPADNATAYREWEEQPHDTPTPRLLQPWVELYSSLPS